MHTELDHWHGQPRLLIKSQSNQATAVAVLMVLFYFHLRRAIARDEEALPKCRWR
jgi:hypothetical protein